MATPTRSYAAWESLLPVATWEALDGQKDARSDLRHKSKGVNQSSSPTKEEHLHRLEYFLYNKVAGQSFELFVDLVGGLNVGAWPGNYELAKTPKVFAGVATTALADSSTLKIYLDSANALVVNQTAFPTDLSSFVPLASITTSGGAITAYTDERNWSGWVVTQSGLYFPESADIDCETGQGPSTARLITAGQNPRGGFIQAVYGRVTEVFAGSTEDQGIITIRDEDNLGIGDGVTLTVSDAAADIVDDIIVGVNDAQSMATGGKFPKFPAGKAIDADRTQATSGGTPAGKMTVSAIIVLW